MLPKAPNQYSSFASTQTQTAHQRGDSNEAILVVMARYEKSILPVGASLICHALVTLSHNAD